MSQQPNKALSHEQRLLIDNHRWLIHRCRKKLERRVRFHSALMADQIHDVTTDALVEAARTFDRQLGPFPAWVARVLERRWQDAVRRAQRRRHAQTSNGWSYLAWVRRANQLAADDRQQAKWVVDRAANAATAQLLGVLSMYSRNSTCSPERRAMLQQVYSFVMQRLVEMRVELSPVHEQVIRLAELEPNKTNWVQIGARLGIDKRTARKRHEEALTWLSRRLKGGPAARSTAPFCQQL